LGIEPRITVRERIVIIENITRYMEVGMRPLEAAYTGAKEIGFTVIRQYLCRVVKLLHPPPRKIHVLSPA
jgi:multidrug efflux pump subunit AcrB